MQWFFPAIPEGNQTPNILATFTQPRSFKANEFQNLLRKNITHPWAMTINFRRTPEGADFLSGSWNPNGTVSVNPTPAVDFAAGDKLYAWSYNMYVGGTFAAFTLQLGVMKSVATFNFPALGVYATGTQVAQPPAAFWSGSTGFEIGHTFSPSVIATVGQVQFTWSREGTTLGTASAATREGYFEFGSNYYPGGDWDVKSGDTLSLRVSAAISGLPAFQAWLDVPTDHLFHWTFVVPNDFQGHYASQIVPSDMVISVADWEASMRHNAGRAIYPFVFQYRGANWVYMNGNITGKPDGTFSFGGNADVGQDLRAGDELRMGITDDGTFAPYPFTFQIWFEPITVEQPAKAMAMVIA